VCISASEAQTDTSLACGGHESYIQGAGDDEEAWALGLVPGLFWDNIDDLLRTNRNEGTISFGLVILGSGLDMFQFQFWFCFRFEFELGFGFRFDFSFGLSLVWFWFFGVGFGFCFGFEFGLSFFLSSLLSFSSIFSLPRRNPRASAPSGGRLQGPRRPGHATAWL
jgi:hypothetical protein